MNFKRKLWWVQHKDKIFRIYAITLTLVLVILGIIYFSYSKFSSSNEMTMYETTVEPFIKNDYFIASYIDGEWSDSIPGKNDGYEVDKIVCDNDAVGTWDSETWSINISNATKKIKCSIYFKLTLVFDFDYTGTEQVFTVPKTGTYKLETWGAQGGSSIGTVSDLNGNYDINNQSSGGFGGYSVGTYYFDLNNKMYINVGGGGLSAKHYKKESVNKNTTIGGYNGGADSTYTDESGDWFVGSGGGATHIASCSGLLSTLENYKENILIVSGGGGGSSYYMNTRDYYHYGLGGHGGGYKGTSSYNTYTSQATVPLLDVTGGYQFLQNISYRDYGVKNGAFGLGATYLLNNNADNKSSLAAGGGGGFYGGSSSYSRGAGGGSGYIGNTLLTNKAMYCYNCEESSEESTKTISTTCAEEKPTENCAKKGNGYARITYIGNDK